jgi:hypothetical protein
MKKGGYNEGLPMPSSAKSSWSRKKEVAFQELWNSLQKTPYSLRSGLKKLASAENTKRVIGKVLSQSSATMIDTISLGDHETNGLLLGVLDKFKDVFSSLFISESVNAIPDTWQWDYWEADKMSRTLEVRFKGRDGITVEESIWTKDIKVERDDRMRKDFNCQDYP